MTRHITHVTVTIAYENLTISITKINVVDNSYIKLRTCKYNISQWQKTLCPVNEKEWNFTPCILRYFLTTICVNMSFKPV